MQTFCLCWYRCMNYLPMPDKFKYVAYISSSLPRSSCTLQNMYRLYDVRLTNRCACACHQSVKQSLVKPVTLCFATSIYSYNSLTRPGYRVFLPTTKDKSNYQLLRVVHRLNSLRHVTRYI